MTNRNEPTPWGGGKSDIQCYRILIFKMSSFQQQEVIEACKDIRMYGLCTSEKTKLKETIIEEAQTLDLLEKKFKSTVLNMLKELKETMDKELKKVRRTMSCQIEHINKETEI